MSIHFRSAATILALALAVLPGCVLFHAHEPVVIPDGAQVVRIAVSGEGVSLEPASVRAGDVYLVNEGPSGSYQFLSSMPTPDASPGPFTQAGVDRIAIGDFQGVMHEGISVECERAWTEADHWTDCGENWHMTSGRGLLRGDDRRRGARGRPDHGRPRGGAVGAYSSRFGSCWTDQVLPSGSAK